MLYSNNDRDKTDWTGWTKYFLTATQYNPTVDIPANRGAGIYIIRIADNKESRSDPVLVK
ncbi:MULTISPECIES: hypothetical protein [Niastella]|uniref:Secretion system C-terminal sorting domain-containing protein n=1 Tax=Niastella soli TaxID=2821487 RepID=A0ABS3YZ34_9BACT|nr:hypothetical protein [Niastella soli]MBO9203181.1 hypothetical protein [Niastella soli]